MLTLSTLLLVSNVWFVEVDFSSPSYVSRVACSVFHRYVLFYTDWYAMLWLFH